MTRVVIAIILCVLAHPALGQQRSFYDSRGRFAGSSVTHGRQTDYFNSKGSYAGSSFGQGTPSNPQGTRK